MVRLMHVIAPERLIGRPGHDLRFHFVLDPSFAVRSASSFSFSLSLLLLFGFLFNWPIFLKLFQVWQGPSRFPKKPLWVASVRLSQARRHSYHATVSTWSSFPEGRGTGPPKIRTGEDIKNDIPQSFCMFSTSVDSVLCYIAIKLGRVGSRTRARTPKLCDGLKHRTKSSKLLVQKRAC